MESTMEEQTTQPVAKAPEFTLVKISDRYRKFADISDVPAGTDAANVIVAESLGEMTKDQLGELYGAVAGVAAKKFKDKKVAIESILYQVAKMPIFDPDAPAQTPQSAAVAAGAKANKAAGAPRESKPKGIAGLELKTPEDATALGKMAPQARELVSILADLAKEKGTTALSGADVEARIKSQSTIDRLRTKQPPERILAYYRKALVEAGFISS